MFFFLVIRRPPRSTLFLHDALPISQPRPPVSARDLRRRRPFRPAAEGRRPDQFGGSVVAHFQRSEEHTSELQSRLHLVCRLLLEKKKELTHTFRAEAYFVHQHEPNP